MATLTVGTNKTYDTISSAVAAMADSDLVNVHKTVYFDEPNIYRESVTMTAGETQTLTFVDAVKITPDSTANGVIISAPSAGKTHTFNDVYAESLTYANRGFYILSVAGTVVMQSCKVVSCSSDGVLASVTATGQIDMTGCFIRCYGSAAYGMDIRNNGAGTLNIINNTILGIHASLGAFLNRNTAATQTINNNFAYSTRGVDYGIVGGAVIGGTNFSTDGSQSTTDIGSIDSASFVDWQQEDIHVKSGSGLDGVGANVGSIKDFDGNTIDTSVNNFAGCSGLRSAPSSPTNATYYHDTTTDDYFVTCDPPANGLDKLRCKVTISGTDYYVIMRSTRNGFEYDLTSDTTVIIAYINQGRLSFNSATAPSAIAVAWVNANSVSSSFTTATEGGGAADYPSENDVRNGISFNSGSSSGNLVVPSINDVEDSVLFGASGNEYTGVFGYPAVGDVDSGVGYGANNVEFTGTLIQPITDDVGNGIQYGAGGIEFTGNKTVPSQTDVRLAISYGASGTQYTGNATFPNQDDVRTLITYGASGNQYTGNVTFPVITDVENGIQYGASGTQYTGNVTLPTVNQVEDSISYGANGNEFTGTITSPSENDVRTAISYGAAGTQYTGNATFPATTDVEDGIQYGTNGTQYTGNVTLPTQAQVESGIDYGANGTEFTGTLTPSGASGTQPSKPILNDLGVGPDKPILTE